MISREVRSSRVFEDDFDPLNVAADESRPKAIKMSKSCTASSVPDSASASAGGGGSGSGRAAAVDPLKRRSMPPPKSASSASDGGGTEQEKTIKVG